MKRETNAAIAAGNSDIPMLYTIARMALVAGMSRLEWHEAHNGELTDTEAQEYDYLMDEFKKLLCLEDELATLRDQVATLTRERDAAREALKPFAAYASYHTANSQIYILEWDSTIPFQAFVNASAVLAAPPRLDSEGARIPFALADDGAATPDVFMDVAKEMDRQVRKWGVQRHDPTLWITILLEEVGEVAKAALETWHQGKDDDPKGEQYRTELVHVMAVAASAVRSLEMNNTTVQA